MGNLRLGDVGYISQKVKPSLERLFGPGQKKTTLLTPGMMLVFPNEGSSGNESLNESIE